MRLDLNLTARIRPSSDTITQFNEKPLVNSFYFKHISDPVEYDHTFCFVDQYTPDTSQSQQYGFKAQPVGTIDELNHAVVSGQVGEDGMTPSRGLNYNAVFTYVAQINRRCEPNSEGTTGANGRTTTTAQNHALTNSATRIS